MTRGIHNTTRPRRLPLSLVGRARPSTPYDFAKVFLRMTAAECVGVCDHYGLLSSVPTVGTSDGDCPSELSAEGALSWMMWNEGRGEWYTQSDPSSISSGTMTLWLDGKDQSTLFSDAGVTPITDGGAVQQWNDKSGGGRHFSQATVGLRPTWSNAGHVAFSVNDKLLSNIATSSFLSTGDNTIFLVATVTSEFSGAVFFSNGGSDQIHNGTAGSYTGRLWNGAIGTSDNTITGKLIDTKYVFMLRRYGGSAFVALSVNGETESPTATSGSLANLGAAFFLGGGSLQFNLHEFIIHNAALNDTDRNNLGLYLASKHNTLWLPKINDYRYRGNLFAENRRANEVRDYLEARFNENKSQFLRAIASVSPQRVGLITRVPPPSATISAAPRTPTKIIFWDSYTAQGDNALDKLLDDPTHGGTADARANLVRCEKAFWNQGGVGAASYNVAYVKSLLDAQPAGRRSLVVNFNPLFLKPITAGAGAGRFQLYDRTDDSAYRRGLSLEDWWTWASDTANGMLKFLADLNAAGGTLDYLITDVELYNRFWQWQWGQPHGSPAGRIVISAVDISANSLTVSGHGLADNDVIAFFGAALPAPLDAYTIYYAQVVDANTIKVRASVAGAAIDLTSSGSGTNYLLRDSWAQIITDANWTANHGNLPSGVRGQIKPVMDQEVWKAMPRMSIYTNEIGFVFSAHAANYFQTYFSELLSLCKSIYPNLRVSDYRMQTEASGTYFADEAVGQEVYGAGHTAAGVSSMPMYGDWPGGRWDWSALADVSFSGTAGEIQWAAFSTQMMRLRRSFAGNHTPIYQPWLTHELYSAYQMMGTAGLWAEFILHAAILSSGVVNFYQPTGSFTGGETDGDIAAAQRKFIDLIEEADNALAHPSTGSPGEPIADFEQACLASRAWAGNRYVARVTPNPTASGLTVTTTAAGVTFTNSLGALTIARGRVHASSQSALAPLGYWVESSQ